MSASSWSWVTSTAVAPALAQDAARRRCAPTRGGSRRGTRTARRGARAPAGRQARARARPAAAGRPRAGVGSGPRGRSSRPSRSARRTSAAAPFAARQAEADVGDHGEVGEQRAFLGDVADAAAFGRHVVGRRRRPSSSPSAIVPRSARSKPAMRRSSVVLPLPEAPRIAVSEPAGDLEVDVAQDRERAERLAHARDREASRSAGHDVARFGSRSNQRPRT